ncbi:ABC transporter permease [Falsiroseomonas selenitidurans]|uniref:ABC transporter permease n=1 Tax=Falsiroseomonas selenitidurans TaxID=2716335 RepID=A0ABX1E208_9PROT|nr:ABC transporter permease [Falsiroseomonas selenitidurans]NKC30823.1 ABC transporter permease [Falsiroseomonas selenitidurans]
MASFLLGRAATLALVLFGASVLIFLVVRALPGDPAIAMMTSNATPEEIQAMREALGLHLPLWVQYGSWVSGALVGDLGRSFTYSTGVSRMILDRFPVTLHISLAALVIAMAIAIPAGVLAAKHKGGLIDHLARVIAMIGISMPVFWQGLLSILLFAVILRWLPPGGYEPLSAGIGVSTAHILLPAVALGTAYAATITRMLRASMLDVLGREHIAVARAHGVPESTIIWTDAFRNALIPTLTAAGFSFGYLLAGAVLTEVIFNLPGMGRLLYESILARDYPLVQGLVLLNVTVFVLINFSMDALYALLDPRIRR